MYQIVIDKITGQQSCINRLADSAFIPLDPANTDYQKFLKYQDEGGRVYAPDEEVPEDGQAAK
jgi:hypothetical protein